MSDIVSIKVAKARDTLAIPTLNKNRPKIVATYDGTSPVFTFQNYHADSAILPKVRIHADRLTFDYQNGYISNADNGFKGPKSFVTYRLDSPIMKTSIVGAVSEQCGKDHADPFLMVESEDGGILLLNMNSELSSLAYQGFDYVHPFVSDSGV